MLRKVVAIFVAVFILSVTEGIWLPKLCSLGNAVVQKSKPAIDLFGIVGTPFLAIGAVLLVWLIVRKPKTA